MRRRSCASRGIRTERASLLSAARRCRSRSSIGVRPMPERALTDAEARRGATTDLDHNLVVVAGAGTGKTSLLVERVLVAVGSGSVRLVQIGAITFTEKAAGEMRVRIATGLESLRAA